jgi:hypothetical protein
VITVQLKQGMRIIHGIIADDQTINMIKVLKQYIDPALALPGLPAYPERLFSGKS